VPQVLKYSTKLKSLTNYNSSPFHHMYGFKILLGFDCKPRDCWLAVFIQGVQNNRYSHSLGAGPLGVPAPFGWRNILWSTPVETGPEAHPIPVKWVPKLVPGRNWLGIGCDHPHLLSRRFKTGRAIPLPMLFASNGRLLGGLYL
jgi:hypothetical protein